MKRLGYLVLLLAAFAVGCAPGRLDDLADCGKASVGIGMGLEAHARIGFLTHPSLGHGSFTSRVGHESRRWTGAWEEFHAVWPMTAMMSQIAGLNLEGCNLSLMTTYSPPFGEDVPLEEEEPHMGYLLPLLVYAGMHRDDEGSHPLAFKEATNLEVGGTLLLVSASVGLNPLEIVDFLAGFVGLDPAGDDFEPLPLPEGPPPGATSPSPDHVTLDLGSGVTMKLVRIPAGTFMMGGGESPREVVEKGGGSSGHFEDEHPRHPVTIDRPFLMGVYEVTQDQYQAVMGKNPSHPKDEKRPAAGMSWPDAVAFCKAMSQKTGRTVRLPTEAEWEYACRAETTGPFNTGGTIGTHQANFEGRETYGGGKEGGHRGGPVPVGSFPSNAWGLHDMHGNVSEWCSDVYERRYDSARAQDEGKAGATTQRAVRDVAPQRQQKSHVHPLPKRCISRVVRGGTWRDAPRYCRSAARGRSGPYRTSWTCGFRVVVALDGAD